VTDSSSTPPAVDAESVDPEHASAERAGETPPHPDAEKMEAALRKGGPLITDAEIEEARRIQATEPGPGTSLT